MDLKSSIKRVPGWPWTLALLGSISLLIYTVYQNAWLSDDAYITLRTVENWLHGHGPVYNIGERVQAYTHPLWMLGLTAIQALLGDVYLSAMLLSFGSLLLWLGLLGFHFPDQKSWLPLLLVLLCCSPAFVSYSTSGLENPLSLLISTAVFLAVIRGASPFRQCLLLALAMLCRLDLLVLLLPLMLWSWRQNAALRNWKAVLAGLSPLVAWGLFSLVYYGFFLPNTYYAKLGSGMGLADRLAFGWHYWVDSAWYDPLGMALLVLSAVFAGVFRRGRASRAMVMGIALYLLYLLYTGGDFMSGRFFMVPIGLAVVLLLESKKPEAGPPVLGVAMGLAVLLSLLLPHHPLRTGADFRHESGDNLQALYPHGIVDERKMYFSETGWIAGGHQRSQAWEARADSIRATGKPREVRIGVSAGRMAFAEPHVHFVDQLALTDPFLARLPAMDLFWKRPGHYPRLVPGDYPLILSGEQSQLADPHLEALRARLAVVTSSPNLWSGDRWRAIWSLHTGAGPDFEARLSARRGWFPLRNATLGKSFDFPPWVRAQLILKEPCSDEKMYFSFLSQEGTAHVQLCHGGVALQYIVLRLNPYHTAPYSITMLPFIQHLGVDEIRVWQEGNYDPLKFSISSGS